MDTVQKPGTLPTEGPKLYDVLAGTNMVISEIEDKIFGTNPKEIENEVAVDNLTYLRDRAMKINDRLSRINNKLDIL